MGLFHPKRVGKNIRVDLKPGIVILLGVFATKPVDGLRWPGRF